MAVDDEGDIFWIAPRHGEFRRPVRTSCAARGSNLQFYAIPRIIVSGRLLTYRTWRGYRRAHFPGASWAVEGDILHALPVKDCVSLITRDIYGDFDLSFHWRLPLGGNSGVFYHVSEELDAPWKSGPEMQLLDNAGHPDGQVPETSCGALYALEAPHDVPPCPPGLFNVARVSVRGPRVEHWLNGVRVLGCDLEDERLRAKLAQTKFRDFPEFARAAEGHIVLQHHGTEAWFHNIRVELPD